MNPKIQKQIAVIFAGFLLLAMAGLVSAQTGSINPEPGGSGPDPIQYPNGQAYLVRTNDLGDLLVRAIDWLIYIAGTIAVVFLLIGGFQYVGSRGNEEGMEKAKKTITGAIIGLVAVIMAYAIVYIISNLVTRAPEESAMIFSQIIL